mmetsp:Transcript_2225/g.6482  ORF Transcript_2225/g.6482 Transcript_2225/m.6482 type:complete len:292 (-) Transcript_2225:162-1037(-)
MLRTSTTSSLPRTVPSLICTMMRRMAAESLRRKRARRRPRARRNVLSDARNAMPACVMTAANVRVALPWSNLVAMARPSRAASFASAKVPRNARRRTTTRRTARNRRRRVRRARRRQPLLMEVVAIQNRAAMSQRRLLLLLLPRRSQGSRLALPRAGSARPVVMAPMQRPISTQRHCRKIAKLSTTRSMPPRSTTPTAVLGNYRILWRKSSTSLRSRYLPRWTSTTSTTSSQRKSPRKRPRDITMSLPTPLISAQCFQRSKRAHMAKGLTLHLCCMRTFYFAWRTVLLTTI